MAKKSAAKASQAKNGDGSDRASRKRVVTAGELQTLIDGVNEMLEYLDTANKLLTQKKISTMDFDGANLGQDGLDRLGRYHAKLTAAILDPTVSKTYAE
jgi:hypothetical protein